MARAITNKVMPSFDKPKKEYDRRGPGDANSGVPRGQRQKLSSEMQHDAQLEDRQEIVKRDAMIAPDRIHVPQCKVCFAPGTLIRTETGFRPIESIQPGERVLGQDGEFHPVNIVMKRWYNGVLNKLYPTTVSRPIMVTPEHPVYKLQGSHPRNDKPCAPSRCNDLIRRHTTHSRGRLSYNDIEIIRKRLVYDTATNIARDYSVHIATISAINVGRNWNKIRNESKHQMIWDDVQNINQSNFIATCFLSEPQDRTIINIPCEFLGQRRRGPNNFQINDEFLWAIGLYLAEGSAGTRCINYALHRDEVEYQDRLVKFWSSHGYTAKIVTCEDKPNSAWVEIYSSTLSEWFPEWLGSGCANKIIPYELLNLPIQKLQPLLRGILDGDGSIKDDRLGQTSELLALGVLEILFRSGETTTIRAKKKRENRKQVWDISAKKVDQNKTRYGTWRFINQTLARVRSNTQEMYTGFVYNLEVSKDPTYVVQNILVHNCIHTSRDFIEMMLVRGQSYKGIADRVNPKVDRRSVSHHYKNHMDLQDMAIRRIIEEEAKLQGKDQEEGVNDIITKRSVLEVALRKGYEDILNGVTTVEPRDLIQITKLLAEMDTDQYHVGMDEMRSQVAIFIRAIKDICDLDVQSAIAQRVKELRTHEGLDTPVENAMSTPPVIEGSVVED